MFIWQATPAEFHDLIEKTREAYHDFRMVPAPRRGEILRQIREALAAKVGLYTDCTPVLSLA
jgi:aldehyde dehydrogenase family 7 member A1